MPSSEVATAPVAGELQQQWNYAKALATATTLPKAYREKPGDVLLAMEYGRALDLPSVATVMTSVHIIDGRPSMSAELMQALVRRAGHRIRVKGDSRSATCAIVRRDDPDYQYSVTFTLDDARLAKLVPAKPDSGWTKYPRAMLKARAISECCREACADVLAGVSYVPEELGASDWAPSMGAGVTTTVTAEPIRQPDADSPLTVESDPPERNPKEGDPVTQEGADTIDPDSEAERNAGRWRASWLARLDLAVESRDLEVITALAGEAGGAGYADLLDDARSAWSDVQGQLADA